MGGGLAGLSTAVELLDQGYEVDIYEGRQWVGGKVASFQDKDGNHIEVGPAGRICGRRRSRFCDLRRQGARRRARP